jgi:predicted O-linked N-acetylglucosamine transferase (SPINDLY family)
MTAVHYRDDSTLQDSDVSSSCLLSPVSYLLQEGLAAHQAGALDVAEARYREVLRTEPQQPDALHLLGVIALQHGRLGEAETMIRAALNVAPEQPTFWNNLGAVARAAGRPADAAVSFERAVALAPEYTDAWASLVMVRQALQDAAGEAAALERLTALTPAQAWVWGRRAILAYQAGRLDEAATLLTRSVTLAPDDPETWSNLGAVQLRLGQVSAAEASQRRALALCPNLPIALNNLGNVLVTQSCWSEAADVLARMVTVAPDEPNGWTNLGHALKGLERYADAVAAYEHALGLRPDQAMTLVGLGDARQGLGEIERALCCYERALALGAADADTLERYGIGLHRLGRLADAAAAFRQSVELDPSRPSALSCLIVVLDLQAGAEAEAQVARRHWNARFGRPALATGRQVAPHAPGYPNDLTPDRPLRVGYVSADFRHHSAAYTILPVLRHHDHSRVQVVCYSGVTAPDGITDQIRSLADVWHDTAWLSDDDLDALIRADQIDILVDLSGHTGGNRLPVFARQPAPVQVTAWGYATGTGLDAMGYFLADPITVPADARNAYTEEIVDLPSVICYAPPTFAPPVGPLPALTRGYVTFGAFNRLPKISAETLATWGRVLIAVPTARLLIKSPGLENAPACERLLAGLAAFGVEPERVSLLGSSPHPEHLAAHAEIDLMLDTFPHTGGITTLDALLMGVPVVTLLGQRVPGRLSASFLTVLGLADLVAQTPAEYVEIAARAANDLGRLAHERATLRDRLLTSPIGDGQQYAHAVEDVYAALWQRWRDEETELVLSAAKEDRRQESGVAGKPALPLRQGWGEDIADGLCAQGTIS